MNAVIKRRRSKVSRLLIILSVCFISSNSLTCSAQVEIEPAFPELLFDRPVDLQVPRDGSHRVFVVEQSGLIKVFDHSATSQKTRIFLDIRNKVHEGHSEEGLLGLAFHPDFKENGYFYVDYTATRPRRTVIARYQAHPPQTNQAQPDTATILLEIRQPYGNHNGGQISFGPDGFLYIAMGDGGHAGDPHGHGQNLETLLGSILRIDVNRVSAHRPYAIPEDNPFVRNGFGYREEIFAYGLRNPWRFSWDRKTGSLWTGDVGQDKIEEVDIIEKGKNYGWNILEGNRCFNPRRDCDRRQVEAPIVEYTHALGQSITGGFVYRGRKVPQLTGAYIYADFLSGRIWALWYDDQQKPRSEEILKTRLNISSFGEDETGELYLCAFDGRIYRFKEAGQSTD